MRHFLSVLYGYRNAHKIHLYLLLQKRLHSFHNRVQLYWQATYLEGYSCELRTFQVADDYPLRHRSRQGYGSSVSGLELRSANGLPVRHALKGVRPHWIAIEKEWFFFYLPIRDRAFSGASVGFTPRLNGFGCRGIGVTSAFTGILCSNLTAQ